jgi:ketosteroid isomerase-like protein
MRKNPNELADEWKAAINSRDLDRIVAMYSDDVVFKSPRVISISGKESGVLTGKAAVRAYWAKILERRPNLECTVEHVFAGVDSVALEYRFAHGLHGIEFMTLDTDGLAMLAVGNDVVRRPVSQIAP